MTGSVPSAVCLWLIVSAGRGTMIIVVDFRQVLEDVYVLFH